MVKTCVGVAAGSAVDAGTFFRMGAVVAVSEMYGSGRFSNAEDARRFLASFGVVNLVDVETLGIKGPYINDLEEIFAHS